eukprot:253235_1
MKQMENEIKSLKQQINSVESYKDTSIDNDDNIVTPVILSKKLTQKSIPKDVAETLLNAFNYMTQYLHIYGDDATQEYKFQETMIKVIDYNIHCKQTQNPLYVVCEKAEQLKHNDHSWKAKHYLYDEKELATRYNITSLPVTPSMNCSIILKIKNTMNRVKEMLQDTKKRNDIIRHRNTPWNCDDKIPIFNKTSKNNGMCLTLSKDAFAKKLNTFANESGDIHLVPIVRFNKKNNYFYEVAWIAQIGKDINIGISFKLNPKGKSVFPYIPSAIYLDIRDQHKLVLDKHNCKCLANFKSIIDRLQIGKSDVSREYQSKMNRQMNEHKNEMNEYMKLREKDMLVIDQMTTTCTNLQRDLQSLLQLQNQVAQQQNVLNTLQYQQQVSVLSTLNINPTQHQQQIQIHNNQLTNQINYLNHNEFRNNN